jgi:glycosyltransferase involved in cell wall biosynthesis
MMPLQVMLDQWYQCEIFAIDSQVKIEEDPNFVSWVTVIYYKNIFQYLSYLLKNRSAIFYSNSLTIKTLLVWMIGRKTVFYPHDNIFWRTDTDRVKEMIIKFFYKYFSIVRINNKDEAWEIEKIKAWLAYICPLVVSKNFLDITTCSRSGSVFLWNLTTVKNPYFLLDTCDILKKEKVNFSIKLIGQDRIGFKANVIERGLEDFFEFSGFISHDKLVDYLKSASIYINTSLWEWQCIAVYEWALAGCHLCLPNIRSFPSVFWENALYHNSPKELAENIKAILGDNKKDSKNIIINQKMILERYDYDRIYEEIKGMFLLLESNYEK